MSQSAATAVDVRSLLNRPGATSSLDRAVPAPAGVTNDLVRIGPQVTVHATIESVVDGLLVRGTVSAPAEVACSRCLVERTEDIDGSVAELFSPPDDDDIEVGYAVADATIDIDTMIRDALAAALPVRPLCRPDCAGLCPTCGADLNAVITHCDGRADQHDARWSPLADLELPDA